MELVYDPAAYMATLRPDKRGWFVWVERAQAEPATLVFFPQGDIGEEPGNPLASSQDIVIDYIEHRLEDVGFKAVRRPESPTEPAIAVWELGPAGS